MTINDIDIIVRTKKKENLTQRKTDQKFLIISKKTVPLQ